jgi:hypothetical protein
MGVWSLTSNASPNSPSKDRRSYEPLWGEGFRRLQQFEPDLDRGEAHGLAADVAEALLARNRRRAAPGAGEMDEADRLFRRPAVRPGDAGDADRDVGARSAQRPLGKRPRRLLADRAMP